MNQYQRIYNILIEERPGHPHPPFGFAELLNELSPELLNRASKQAEEEVNTLKDFAEKQIKRSKRRTGYKDHKRNPRRNSDGTLKDNPYTALAVKLRSAAQDRADQGTRFAARAKGVKTRRPPREDTNTLGRPKGQRGYSVGNYIRNVWGQALSQFQIDKNDWEEKKRRERRDKGDDVFP
jgi:ElaB/YqjD/DUF883 family membrane-anchored ribosome-binding protein